MMVDISAKLVQELRQKTGVGMMDCKKALQATNGNVEKSIEWLRQKGIASAINKTERITAEGLIESYVHTGGKVGVLLKVYCETDFAPRSEVFQVLAKDIAMQIAAYSNIEYVNISDIPTEIVAREKAIEMGRDDLANKPDNIKEKIVGGRIQKRLKEMSLMEQPYMRDQSITVAQRVNQAISVLGENIQVNRFVRFVLGE